MKRVVFVVGAGASCTYGGEHKIPTASGLKEMVVSQTRLSDKDFETGRTLGGVGYDFTAENSKSLKLKLGGSGDYSVDRFLELNPELEDLGKKLICAALLPLEANAIRHPSLVGGWYQWLFNELRNAADRTLHTAGLTIVTFNYDRTLEYALATMLVNSLGKRPEEAMQIVNGMSIHHVYGALSSDYRFNTERLCFECSNPRAWITKSASSIRVVSKNRDTPEDSGLKAAAQTIAQADYVLFLGFGFDSTNVRRIGIKPGPSTVLRVMRHVQVRATMYGVREAERKRIKQFLQNSNLEGAEVELGDDCEGLLRDHVDLRGLLAVPD